MKKRLFVLFMAAAVAFTGMPATFANAADDATVATSEDDQPSELQTVSGNYGVNLSSETKFSSQLNSTASALYEELKVGIHDWKKNIKEGQTELNISIRSGIPGSNEDGTGSLPATLLGFKTEINDNFNTALYDALNALRNTYPQDFVGLNTDYKNMSCVGALSNKTSDTNVVLTIQINSSWNKDLDDEANKVAEKICEEAKAYAEKQSDSDLFKNEIIYFDQWLVKNVDYVSTIQNTLYASTEYGAFLPGDGDKACDPLGYAKAMSCLLDKIDVKNEIVLGKNTNDSSQMTAWNIVELKGKSYILDTFRNDYTSSYNYYNDNPINPKYRLGLLIGQDSFDISHNYISTGVYYDMKEMKNIKAFSFTTVNTSDYIELSYIRTNIIALKKSAKLDASDLKTWVKNKYTFNVKNPQICKVSKKGVVKGLMCGQTEIEVKNGDRTVETVSVYVYQLTGLEFSDNHTKSLEDSIYVNDTQNYVINVMQATGSNQLNASEIRKLYNQKNKKQMKVTAKVTSGKKYLQIEDGDVKVSNNNLYLKVKGIGNVSKERKAKVKIYYGNKSATLKLIVKPFAGTSGQV